MEDQTSDETQRKSSTAEHMELPPGWRIKRRTSKSAVFAYGDNLSLQIEPRFQQISAQRETNQNTFRVILWKRIYAYQPVGEPTILGTTETFDNAIELAYEYMSEFVDARQEVAMETRSNLEADPNSTTNTEESILTEAAINATTEVTDYSDEKFVKHLREILEIPTDDATAVQAIFHRDGAAIDAVFVAEGREEVIQSGWDQKFEDRFGSISEQLQQSASASRSPAMIYVVGETRVIRFPAGEEQETVILLDPDWPVHLPSFERQVADIVSARWEPEA